MAFAMQGIRKGIALGVSFAIVGSLGSAVGFSSHPVSDPRAKACEGNPPRQTVDPLSPPCDAFFDGDNGGRTAPGVTGDEVVVVLYNDLGITGDLTLPYSPDDEQLGHQASQGGEQTDLVRTLKAQVRFFQDRFQTFDRRVRIVAVTSSGGITTPCASRRVEARVIERDYDLFAVTLLGDGMGCFIREMRAQGIPTYGSGRDISRSDLGPASGLAWSFWPTLEDETDASAQFICDKLSGEAARFALDPQLASSERRFGLLYPKNSQRGPESAIAAGRLLDQLEERCGIEWSIDGTTPLYIKSFNNDGKSQAHNVMLDLKLKGVTTVICYCVPVATELTVAAFQAAATSIGYFPEWYWDTTSRMFRSVWNRTHGSRVQASFGMTPEWDGGTIERRYPWRAFKSVDPAGTPNTRFNDDIYHSLLILFGAIQLAGPDLTTANAAAGLQTWALRSGRADSADGGFEVGKGQDRTAFHDRYLSWWFDPLGHEPGMDARTGCVRTNGGIGSADGWDAGDADLFVGGWCTGAPIRNGVTSGIL